MRGRSLAVREDRIDTIAGEQSAQVFLPQLCHYRLVPDRPALRQQSKRTLLVRHGKLQHFAPIDDVYVYFRYAGDGTVMVALNRNATALPLALDRYCDFISAKSRGHDLMTGAEVAFDQPLSLGAKRATILQIE